MSATDSNPCCPKFDPGPWEEKTIAWENKRFVKDRVTSFFHIPLNFAAVMKRNVPAIEAAGALPENCCVLADENSLWGAERLYRGHEGRSRHQNGDDLGDIPLQGV